jgi:7 transmembrane receptor (Secretin family)
MSSNLFFFHFVLVSASLCGAASDSSLLFTHKLRVDALRGLLPSYCSRFRLHLRAEAREVANSDRMECSSAVPDTLRRATRLCQRRRRPDSVSATRRRPRAYPIETVKLSCCFRCWMNGSPYTNVLVAPVCLSMLLNLLFLCNIVRVVLLKLKAPASMSNGPGSGPSRNILQAFR